MTLALHGKSRQRQLFLLILALVTVGAAVFAGAVVQRAEMAFAATASGYAGSSTGDWSSDSNMTGSNTGTFATTQDNGQQQTLGNFGISIPSGSTVNGIEVNVYGYTTGTCTLQVELAETLGPGTDVSSSRSGQLPEDTASVTTFGGPNDTWGETWSAEELVDGEFYVLLETLSGGGCDTSGGGQDTWYIGYVQVVVHYTEPGPTPTPTPGPAAQIPAPNSNPGGFNQCVAPNIMLVIDNSTSIGATELANMKTAVNSMIGQVESALPGTNWAGVHFRRPLNTSTISTPTELWNGGTANITSFVNTAITEGYTPTANGINAAIGLGLGPNGQPPLMIIITDGDPNVQLNNAGSAGTSETAYVNGAIDAVTQANLARSSGFNTLLAFFGPGDSNAQSALGGDYAAYNAAVRNGLAGIPNGSPTGTQISVGNASGLAAAITDALLANCQGSVTINKLLDGQPANGWQFTASVSGGTANPAGPYTTAGAGSASFNIDFPAPSSTATVSVTETGIGGTFDSSLYSFDGAVCTGSLNDGTHTVDIGTRTISGIQVGNNSIVTCTVNNTTNPTTGSITLQKMVPDGQGGWVEDIQDIWGFTVAGQPASNGVPVTGLDLDVSHPWTELVPSGWRFVGSYAAGDAAQCTANPGPGVIDENVPAGETVNRSQLIADNPPDAAVDTLVCVYNVPVREITVQKMVPNPAGGWMEDDQATFWGFKVGPAIGYGDAANQSVNNGATNTFVAGSDLYVFEQVPTGWQRVGYSRLNGADATCSTTGFATTSTGGAGSTVGVGLGPDSSETVCFYNERDLDPVTVTKIGTGTYDVDWSVTKTVTPGTLNLPENGEGDTDYTVTVDKTISGVEAGGNITITNPNPVAIDVTVSDPNATLGGACATNPVTVPANDSVECSWSDSIGGNSVPTGYTNTVTVSGPWDGADVSATTDPVNFTIDQGSDTTTVNDNFAGNVTGGTKPNGNEISTSTTYNYTATHTCEGITNWSQQDGSGSKTVENTATISDTVGNNNSDDADVDINCQLRKVTLIKVVEGGDASPNAWLLTATDNTGESQWTFSGLGNVVGYVPTEWSFFLSESGGVDGYTLDRILCAVGNGPENNFTNGGPVNLAGTNNDDLTCTFYNVADQALTVSKTAFGTHLNVWDWEIDKDGEITEITREAGELFGVGYTTTSTPTVTGRGSGTVTGSIRIDNANNFGVVVNVSDNLGSFTSLSCNANPGGSVANPESGFTVPANGYVTCLYSIELASAEGVDENTVTVTSSSHPELGGNDTATIDWSPISNPADPAFLEDTDNQGSLPYTATYTSSYGEEVEDYARNFQCPAWPSDVYYDNGVFTGEYTFDIVNTAVLYKNDSLEGDEWDRDEHTVEVTCTVDRGSVDVQKTVDWNGVPAANQPEASFDICIAGPFEDMDAASSFLTSMPSTPFAPNSAPSGDWEECISVGPGEFAEFDELVPGAYAVAEKNPGTAWAQTTGPWAVNVEPGDEDRLAGINGITNQYQRGDLTVTKDIELAGGDLPANSEFDICIQGPSYPLGTEDAACRTFTTEGQSETWQDIIPGAYTVTEINTEPDGVQWATTITNGGNVTVNAGAESSATVTNTLVTGDLAVTKVIEWSGYTPDEGDLDGNPWSGFEICIQGPSYPLGTEAGACQVVTNVNGETLQWDNLAAGTYTVIETDPGTQWSVEVDPNDADSAGVVTCAPTDDQCVTPQVTITNTLAPAELTICKDFVGDETDEGVLPGIQRDGQTIETPWDEGDCFTIDVAPFTPVTVTEVLPEGYFPAQAPVLSGQCTIQPVEIDVAQIIIAQTLSFLGLVLNEDWLEVDLTGIPAGESCEITFTNEPVGELVIVKVDNVGEGNNTWTFDVDNGEVADAAVIIGSDSDTNTVRTGTYSVTEREVDGLNRVAVCEVTSPPGSYQVRVQVDSGEPFISIGAEVAVNRGETTTVTFYNDDCGRLLGGANLFVNKFEASAEGAFSGTTGLEGWTMELTCVAGECESGGFPGSLDTDATGLASFGQVPSGIYQVCEVAQPGYDVVGSLLDGSDPVDGTCREVTVTDEAAGLDGNIVVDFFNYPLGGIRVEKRQLEGGALDVSDNGGWEITIEGCGESFTQTTNEAIPNSWTVFENLPACDEYVVSENVNSKPGYTPVGPASYEFSFAPGDDLVFTFVNDTVEENTPTPTPPTEETPTPTNTPGTPTNTPEPTETPVSPTEEPTATPTPIDDVEGEITPGASPTSTPGSAATPIPPASGTGLFGASSGSSMFMVLLALLMTSTGLAALAMARGRANGGSRR